MKKIVLFVMSLALFSCKKEEKKEVEKVVKEEIKTPEIHKELYGIYTGDFFMEDSQKNIDQYPNADFEYKKLSIKLNKITKDSVYGYSVVNGNQRKFRGVFNENSSKFILNEEGKSKSDGKFELILKKDSLSGTWLAYQPKNVKSPEKKVLLKRREFAYNPNFMLKKDEIAEMDYENPVDWEEGKVKKQSYTDDEGKIQYYENTVYRSATDAVYKINASKEKLTEKRIKNLRKLDLEIIKNAIYRSIFIDVIARVLNEILIRCERNANDLGNRIENYLIRLDGAKNRTSFIECCVNSFISDIVSASTIRSNNKLSKIARTIFCYAKSYQLKRLLSITIKSTLVQSLCHRRICIKQHGNHGVLLIRINSCIRRLFLSEGIESTQSLEVSTIANALSSSTTAVQYSILNQILDGITIRC